MGQTLSAFTITLYGLGSFIFDVNDTHIENGAANFTLPLNGSDPMLDVCNLGGVVFGSNEVGNSTAENIQLPDGKQVFDKHDACCYVYVFGFAECLSVTPTSSHAAVATTTPTTAPPPTVASTTEPSQSDSTTAVVGIYTCMGDYIVLSMCFKAVVSLFQLELLLCCVCWWQSYLSVL